MAYFIKQYTNLRLSQPEDSRKQSLVTKVEVRVVYKCAMVPWMMLLSP